MSLPPIVTLDLTERAVLAQEAVAASLAILASHVASPQPEVAGYVVGWRSAFGAGVDPDVFSTVEAARERAAELDDRYAETGSGPHRIFALVEVAR